MANERARTDSPYFQLLQNVSLMLDASFALMNQYQAITANLIANEAAPPTPNVAATNVPTTSVGATNVTTETVEAKIVAPVTSDVNMPGTSADAKRREREDLIKIEDLGSEDQDDIRNVSLGETSEASELRRRRLQKFLQTEQRND